MTEQDQPQGQPTPQAPTEDPASTAGTRQEEVTEVRKAIYGEVPPLFGLVANPGEVTGTPAPDVVPSVAPDTSSPSPSSDAPTEGGS
jgi:hypothetical protein